MKSKTFLCTKPKSDINPNLIVNITLLGGINERFVYSHGSILLPILNQIILIYLNKDFVLDSVTDIKRIHYGR